MSKYLLKGCLVGPSCSGKTWLVHNFEGKTIQVEKSTIGMDLHATKRNLNGTDVTYQVWDTAGQERFLCYDAMHFRGAMFCVLVGDLTDPSSLQNLETHFRHALREIKTDDPDKFPFILAMNKCDLVSERRVTKAQIERWCAERNIPFMEVSALQGTNVEEVFNKVGALALKELKKAEPDEPKIQLTVKMDNGNTSTSMTGGGCC